MLPSWAIGLPGSRLGRTIIALNLLGLAILVAGALVFNELRRGLIDAQVEGLQAQGEVFAKIIEQGATRGVPEPVLDADRVREVFLLMFPHESPQRVRLFDAQGNLIADSFMTTDQIERHDLPPIRKPGGTFRLDPSAIDPEVRARGEIAAKALEAEVEGALRGQVSKGPRPRANGGKVVSVSIPVSHVKAVTGVLTLESGDVDEIIARQRWALVPFIAIALMVTLISSFLMNRVIARPVRRLARAADQVRLSQARSISLPDLEMRDDELGDLGRALETMTTSLSERMDAIERFAADVAHEIRNPLTSIRSAVETLDLVSDPKAKDRLTAILKQDVNRLDRLITDISNFSRLDAELSRDAPRPIRLDQLLADTVSLYDQTSRPDDPPVRLAEAADAQGLLVAAREGPLSQVFRNLIDNARSFTALTGRDGPAEVRVALRQSGGEALVSVDDDGPGIPAENLETVFERFYTSRPKGSAFGGNSGLGLSIARQIVMAHRGRIWAENRLAPDGSIAGARFVVALPLQGGA